MVIRLDGGLFMVKDHSHSLPWKTWTNGVMTQFAVGLPITLEQKLDNNRVRINTGGYIENPVPEVDNPAGLVFRIVRTEPGFWFLEPLGILGVGEGVVATLTDYLLNT